MPQLKTFISNAFRPEINGAMLDRHHRTPFFIKKKSHQPVTINAICFGPKKDKVLLNLEHAIVTRDKILILYYEDIHKRWSYVQTAQENYFVYQKNKNETLMITPKCLYIRGCYIKPNTKMWRILGNFYSFTNTWKGKILCAPKRQCSNESKLYQLNQSLKQAATNKSAVSIGKSYVIKGPGLYEQKIAQKSCIVKSLSGIRSIVVDQKQYAHWNKKNIHHLPVLFQEKIEGQDLRVHVIQNQTFSKLSLSKDNIDYRYDKSFFKLKNIKTLPNDLKQFACLVSQYEKNQLIGIDFIKTKSHHVVLEANPSPGWSAYHECNGIGLSSFIKTLLAALK
ncbi:MAG: ATP-grasp domain-containing protein [Gammaproteobacteria bacterium]|nr:ATP-grasp domain-containing protein [Gammaproteobacteria bacterium]